MTTKDNKRESKMLTPKEAADMLMISPITLRQWANKGLIPALTTLGGHRRYLKSDVEKYLSKDSIEPSRPSIVKKILIIDDDEATLTFLEDMLYATYEENVMIETANNGFEGGLKALSFKPDIVLLDLMMKELNGFKVCQQIKQNALTSDILILTMTGYASKENIQKSLASGAEECFAKPVKVSDIDKYLNIEKEAQMNLN